MTSRMREEIEDIPAAVDRLLTLGGADIERIRADCRGRDLRFLLSVARGSSDHACTYLKYASELQLGLPMVSVGPSVSSIYHAALRVPDTLCLAVSQSGQSPDIVHATRALGHSGAYTVAVTNCVDSPLAQNAHATLAINAGSEKSVAATKTFVTSVVAGLWLLAALADNRALIEALAGLPEQIRAAIECDWGAAERAVSAGSLFTLGRGPSTAISNEAALKFKETCQLHAESYSSAELRHGPISLVDTAFPVIAFAAGDAAESTVAEVADSLALKGAAVFATTRRVAHATTLPCVRAAHPLLDPILLIVSFYVMVERVSKARGINPDAPPHLNKVTETL